MSGSRVSEDGWLEDKTHIRPVRIYYEDTDFSGFVYHASYVRFLERGRSDLLRATGLTHQVLAARPDPLGFVVRRMQIDFRTPAQIEDLLYVHTRFTDLKGARLRARQYIMRNNEHILDAALEVAFVSAGRPRRAPGDVVAQISPFLAPEPSPANAR